MQYASSHVGSVVVVVVVAAAAVVVGGAVGTATHESSYVAGRRSAARKLRTAAEVLSERKTLAAHAHGESQRTQSIAPWYAVSGRHVDWSWRGMSTGCGDDAAAAMASAATSRARAAMVPVGVLYGARPPPRKTRLR